MISGFPKFKQYTEAQMPLPTSVPAGTEVFNATFKVKMESDGTRWIPLAPFVVYNGVLADEVTGTTDLTTMREVTIPAKYIGKNGSIGYFLGGTNNNNANNKTMFVKLGNGTTFWNTHSFNTTTTGRSVRKTIQSDGTEYSFWVSGAGALADSTSTTSPISQVLVPSPDLTLQIQGRLANSADFVRLTRLTITINPSF